MITFPKTPEDARKWVPIVQKTALHSRILAVATTRIEGAWSAYIAPVPGIDHNEEMTEVLRTGNKLHKDLAVLLFPMFAEIPYAK